MEPIYAVRTMIYKFKSKATSDLIMLQANGEAILKLIKRSDASQLKQGILLPEDMPQAVAALQAAVELEEQLRAQQVRLAHEEGRLPPAAPVVSLRQRSAPFIQMLQRCLAANEEIVWGV